MHSQAALHRQQLQRPPRPQHSGVPHSSSHVNNVCSSKRRRAPVVVVFAAAESPSSPSSLSSSSLSSLSSSSPVSWSQTSNGAWVASPRGAASARRPPPGVVHLLGGAFAGAAPQILYAKLAEALAAPPARRSGGGGSSGSGSSGSGGGGFTVIATPYRLTFDHIRSAERVRRDLREAAEEVAASGEGGPHSEAARRACAALLNIGNGGNGGGSGGAEVAPLFAVGHSNGALLHALGACQQQRQAEEEEQDEQGEQQGEDRQARSSRASFPPSPSPPTTTTTASLPLLRPRGTVLLSYNNKGVGDAIPFGILDGLRAALGPPGPDGEDDGAPVPPSLPPLPPALAEALPARVARASPALEQVATVTEEVRRGVSDFSPPPARTREIVSAAYPRAALAARTRTLLVRFSDDATDETPELRRLLEGCPGLDAITLPGTHLTPCGADEALLSGSSSGGGGPPAFGAASASSFAGGGVSVGGGRAVAFTPADALSMAAREWGRAARERDADRLAERVVSFLRAAAAAPPSPPL